MRWLIANINTVEVIADVEASAEATHSCIHILSCDDPPLYDDQEASRRGKICLVGRGCPLAAAGSEARRPCLLLPSSTVESARPLGPQGKDRLSAQSQFERHLVDNTSTWKPGQDGE